MKKIYEKFLMKINGLIYNDKDFLKKYKDTILKVKISTYTLLYIINRFVHSVGAQRAASEKDCPFTA